MQCPYQPLSAWVRSATTVTRRVHARSQYQRSAEEAAVFPGGASSANRSARSSSQPRHSRRASTTSGAVASGVVTESDEQHQTSTTPPSTSPSPTDQFHPQAHRPYRLARNLVTRSNERQRFSRATSALGSKGTTRPANSFAPSAPISKGCRAGSTSAHAKVCAHSSLTIPLCLALPIWLHSISSGRLADGKRSSASWEAIFNRFSPAWSAVLVNTPLTTAGSRPSWEPPELEGGRGLLDECADLRVGPVHRLLTDGRGLPPSPTRGADRATGTPMALVGPARDVDIGEGVDDAVFAGRAEAMDGPVRSDPVARQQGPDQLRYGDAAAAPALDSLPDRQAEVRVRLVAPATRFGGSPLRLGRSACARCPARAVTARSGGGNLPRPLRGGRHRLDPVRERGGAPGSGRGRRGSASAKRGNRPSAKRLSSARRRPGRCGPLLHPILPYAPGQWDSGRPPRSCGRCRC
ncbi:hypothetical protein SUDANB91_07039 [Streptomyces sp. SudanB91_2054]